MSSNSAMAPAGYQCQSMAYFIDVGWNSRGRRLKFCRLCGFSIHSSSASKHIRSNRHLRLLNTLNYILNMGNGVILHTPSEQDLGKNPPEPMIIHEIPAPIEGTTDLGEMEDPPPWPIFICVVDNKNDKDEEEC